MTIENIEAVVSVDDKVIFGTRFFVDETGAFIGGFGDGAEPPAGAVEVELPPPDGSAIWNGGAWTMPLRREGASLSKIAFCRALYTAQILPADTVAKTAMGEFPAQFRAALAGMTEAEIVDAELAWAGATEVPRMAPLFLALLGYYSDKIGLNTQQATAFGDQIFGITS